MSTAAPPSPALLTAIAATLGELAGEAEQFGLALCADNDVATRHLVQLQQIDKLAQSLREVARVISAQDPGEAVGAVCLGDLRGRLEHALVA